MPSATDTTTQPELFAVETVQGYAQLGRKEQLFAQALFEGRSQRDAARHAGITGDDSAVDVAASKLVRTGKVQAVMNQAWTRSGASIEDTLRQAAELQRRAFAEAATSGALSNRKVAFEQWLKTSALIASIHGKLSVKVTGTVTHEHGGMINIIPESALTALAAIRRDAVSARMTGTAGGTN